MKCNNCGIEGVRLYRLYSTPFSDLECRHCSYISQKRLKGSPPSVCASLVGYRVAAVPLESGDGYYGYGSPPNTAWDAWFALPDNPIKKDL